MRIVRILLVVLSVMVTTMLMATKPSKIVVTKDGKAYYKHMVVKGQTLYSLSKVYGVAEQEIIDSNEGIDPSALRAGVYIYIPRAEEADAATVKDDSKKFIIYQVKAGDTIYTIARKNKISVEMLEHDNPEIDVENISPGQQIRIRRADRGYATADDIERERLSRSAAKDDELKAGEHRVKAGETIYSISRTYGISEEAIMALNGITETSQLKAGMVIKVTEESPEDVNRRGRSRAESDDVVADTLSAADGLYGVAGDDAVDAGSADAGFISLNRYHTLKMALMLPFHMNGKVNPYYVDFYRGVLVALEDIKAEGYDVEVSVFDTEGSGERVGELMSSEQGLADAQLIIGPVYESELSRVLSFAEQGGVPVVSPLADVETLQSPVLFQMQAENEYKNDKIADIFDGSREIVMIHSSTMDDSFVQEMRTLSAGAPSSGLNYVFDRESFFYTRNADGTNGELVDIFEYMRTKTSKAFIIIAKSETEVDRILTTLSSTKSSIVGRGMTYGDYVVVGNRRWMQSANIDRQSFFRNQVVFVVPYYANRSDENIRMFDGRYVKMYGVLPTMYSYRGYDATMIFCRKMFSGIDDTMFEESLTPLATTYRFKREDGIYLNSNWVRVQYNSNFTIDVK